MMATRLRNEVARWWWLVCRSQAVRGWATRAGWDARSSWWRRAAHAVHAPAASKELLTSLSKDVSHHLRPAVPDATWLLDRRATGLDRAARGLTPPTVSSPPTSG